MNWNYIQPVQIFFGEGRRFYAAELAQSRGLKRGILICDPFLAKNGVMDELIAKSGGLYLAAFSDIRPNPELSSVDSCVQLIRSEKADFISAVGGGSSIDLAKAASAVSVTGDSIRAFFTTGKPLPSDSLPLFAIPSTAGTGSEVTCVSVLTDGKKGVKAPVVSEKLYPSAAIIDPELTYSVPSKITAITGLDVLSHAIEGFTSVNHQPACDLYCVEAARLAFGSLEAAAGSSLDKEAKNNMALASVFAGMGFNLPKTGPAHACSFVLTNKYGIPHGEACALTLDHFIRYYAQNGYARLDFLAKGAGMQNTAELADRVAHLKKTLSLRTGLSGLSIGVTDLDQLVAASRHPNMANSPVPVSDGFLKSMYERMR